MSAFFMSYSFKARANGFFGKLEGQKLYEIDYYESVDKLINDALKILRTGGEAEITFEHFDLTTTALSRIYTDICGNAEGVTWKRNSYGYTVETNTEKMNVNKKEVKAFVLRAIELYRDEASKSDVA